MLELYQAEGCPHSRTVRETLTDLGLSYVVHNPRRPADAGGEVLNEQVQAELVAIGNEDQIPVLVDHRTGQLHADSENILRYLEDEYGE